MMLEKERPIVRIATMGFGEGEVMLWIPDSRKPEVMADVCAAWAFCKEEVRMWRIWGGC